ncbi:MAG TPA: redoxin domain-containing protein [Candidatus Dormibacteraeota bacterium]|nr:redoxin domain-containing protein [Candidatus Dormibacteraeota bacterium]
MQGFERALSRFAEHDAQVVGISIDSTHSQRAWSQSLGGLSFPLLADFWPHGEIAKRYGVLRETGFAERAVFIVDERGVVRYIDIHSIAESPDPEQILEELAKL